MMSDLPADHMRATAGAPTPTDSLEANLRWLSERYLRNSGDGEFLSMLGEILLPGSDRNPRPSAIRDPLADETGGLAVVAPSAEGKTSLIRRNLRSLPEFRQQTAATEGNYLGVVMQPEGTIKSLAIKLLADTGYGSVAQNAKSHELWAILRHRIKMRNIQLIWIDETHHLLRSGSGRDVTQARQMLKNLMQGDGAVALLLSGVPELDLQLRGDDETSRRILRLHLDRRFGRHPDDLARLGVFLDTCCRQLGLEPPSDPTFLERVIFAGGGSIGSTMKLLKDSLRRALTAGDTGIKLSHARRTHEIIHGKRTVGPFDEGQWTTIRSMLEEGDQR